MATRAAPYFSKTDKVQELSMSCLVQYIPEGAFEMRHVPCNPVCQQDLRLTQARLHFDLLSITADVNFC